MRTEAAPRSVQRAGLVLVAFTVLGFGVNAAVRLPCHDICGSDIGRDYEVYGINRYHPPFLDRAFEYPPLVGEVVFAATLPFDHGFRGPFLLNALVLTGLAALTTWVLWLRYGSRAWRWALAPPLLLQGLTNWDLLAVAPATVGLLEWEAGNAMLAGALFGAGTAAKLFPALYVPILAVSRLRDTSRLVSGFVLGAAVFVIPAYTLAPGALRYFLHFHSVRTPSRGSVLFFVFRDTSMHPWLPHPTEARAATLVALLALAAAMVALVVLVARRRVGALPACALATMAFMLTNKIYSPQYDLWLIPFLVMLPVRTKLVVHFYVSSCAVWLITAAAPNVAPDPLSLYLVGAAVAYRLVVFAYLARDFYCCSSTSLPWSTSTRMRESVGPEKRTSTRSGLLS
jgi:Glycosyltransferase family 87